MFVVCQQCCEVDLQKVFEVNEVFITTEIFVFHISRQKIYSKRYSIKFVYLIDWKIWLPLKEIEVLFNMHSFFSKSRSYFINPTTKFLGRLCSCNLKMKEYLEISLTGSNMLAWVNSLTKDRKLSFRKSDLFI